MLQTNSDERVFRITLFYKRNPNRKVKQWLYQSKEAWEKQLSKKLLDQRFGAIYLSEEFVSGSWVKVA